MRTIVSLATQLYFTSMYFYKFYNFNYLYAYIGLNITNPPQNVTVCIHSRAEINCGFTGVDPKFAIPNWVIFNNGNNETVFGSAIAANSVSGFLWVPDFDSGANNGPNSKLLFGPVNKTHNQSSFQCIFISSGSQILAASSIGTITVVGKIKVLT